MKTFLLLTAIILASITAVNVIQLWGESLGAEKLVTEETRGEAGCRYIYIDGKAHWVCTNR